MGLGDLGELGDIGMIVGSVVGIGISAIVLLTFAPGIVGDIDGFSLAGTERCEFKGERFRWVLTGSGDRHRRRSRVGRVQKRDDRLLSRQAGKFIRQMH